MKIGKNSYKKYSHDNRTVKFLNYGLYLISMITITQKFPYTLPIQKPYRNIECHTNNVWSVIDSTPYIWVSIVVRKKQLITRCYFLRFSKCILCKLDGSSGPTLLRLSMYHLSHFDHPPTVWLSNVFLLQFFVSQKYCSIIYIK